MKGYEGDDGKIWDRWEGNSRCVWFGILIDL